MPSANRRRHRPNPTRGDLREQQLLAAARRHIDEGRFDSVSIAELAAAAQVTRPTFYFYFESKQDLLIRLLQEALDEIAQRLVTELSAEQGTPASLLQRAISQTVDAWWTHRDIMREALALAPSVPTLADAIDRAIAPANERSVELLLTYGTVPEAASREQAAQLVSVLVAMNERAIDQAIRTAPNRSALHPLEEQLVTVWTRAFGLE